MKLVLALALFNYSNSAGYCTENLISWITVKLRQLESRVQRFFSSFVAPQKREDLDERHDQRHGKVYTGKISAHDKHDQILQLSDIMHEFEKKYLKNSCG